MKKTLIALAVAGAAIAAGANAGELYNQDGTTLAIGGRAEARMSVLDGDSSDYSRVRLNVLGKQQISDALYGIGFYEVEYSTNDVEGTAGSDADAGQDTLNHRYIYAGLGGNFGQVTYGKNDGALVQVTNPTDFMDAHSGNNSREFSTAGDHFDNMLQYKGVFNDLSVNASYRFADRTSVGTDVTDYSTNGLEGYAASAMYTVGQTGLAVGAGFASQHGTTYTGSNDLTATGYQYVLSASYTMKALYVGAMYTTKDYSHSSNDYDGYALAAKYKMDKTLFAIDWERGKNDDETSKINSLAAEVAYYFKPNVHAYIDYTWNLLDGSDYSNAVLGTVEDEAMLGLRYDF